MKGRIVYFFFPKDQSEAELAAARAEGEANLALRRADLEKASPTAALGISSHLISSMS